MDFGIFRYLQDGPVLFANYRMIMRITHLGYMQDGPAYNAFRFFAIYRTVLGITSA